MKNGFLKKTILFALLIATSNINAQKNSQLKNYLEQNSRPLVLTDTNYYFTEIMKNKNLFVMGEGGSHELVLQNKLRAFLVNQFAPQHLKYFFYEMGRSSSIFNNNYLHAKKDTFYKNYDDFNTEMLSIKNEYKHYPTFKYIGIDMEWGIKYFSRLQELTNKISANDIKNNNFLKASLIDTSYFLTNDLYNYKQQEKFLTYFKDTLIPLFKSDTNNIKKLVGLENFLTIKYILQNNQLNGPLHNRNPGMAKNLLEEIVPLDSTATYLLGTGAKHSQKNIKDLFVGRLCSSNVLKNKVVVMNEYCDECVLGNRILKGKSMLNFMNKKYLKLFRSIAKTDLTIFDVSKLPNRYRKIKKHGELILFAKQQH